MSIFNMFRHKESPKNEAPAGPEKELEQEMGPDAETLEKIGQLDGKIADSENLLGGLGRVAREKILTDPEAFEEIYAPKEIGKMDLKGKYDITAFESAGKGLLVRNAIKRAVTLGLAGSKYALAAGEHFRDKRKLGQYMENIEFLQLSPDEQREAAEKFGFEPGEIKSEDFSKKYVEGKKGAEKVILREKTEQEMDQAAGEIMFRRLTDLETKTGPDLIKQKQGLEEFKKLKEQNKDILDEDGIQAKLNEEEVTRQGMINEKQEALNSNLEIFRSPLLEQQKGLAAALESFSPILAEAAGQEKAYEQEIKGLQDKIRRIKGAKPLAEALGDKIQEWEEQKAQAEANQKDFKEKKAALNKRIVELKRSQAEVNRTLASLDKIGKTPTEVREKQAAKEKTKAEDKKAGKEAAGKGAPTGSSEEKKRGVNFGKPRIRIDKKGKVITEAPTEIEGGGGADTSDDDLIDEAAARQDAEEKERQAIDQEISTTGWRAAAKTRPKAEPRSEVIPAVGTTTPEQRPEAEDEAKGVEKRETEIARPVRFWLNAIFEGKIREPIHDKIMRKHFKLGEIFDKFSDMRWDQAEKALTGFIIEAKGFMPRDAKKEARNMIEKIVDNIDDYDRKEAEADTLGQAPGAPEVRRGEISKGEKLKIKFTDEELISLLGKKRFDELTQAEALREAASLAANADKTDNKAADRPRQNKKKPTEKNEDDGRANAARRLELDNLKRTEVNGDIGRAGDNQRTTGRKSNNPKKQSPEQITAEAKKRLDQEREASMSLNHSLESALAGVKIDDPETEKLGVAAVEQKTQLPEAAPESKPQEAGQEVIKFSGQEWLGFFKLENSSPKQKGAIKKYFGSKELTKEEAVDAYTSYFKEVGGLSETLARGRAENIIKDVTS